MEILTSVLQQDKGSVSSAGLTIAVLGAGTMGSQIARLFAEHGFNTRLFDACSRVLEEVSRISGNLGNLRFSQRLEDAVHGAGLVVESIYENLEAKRALFSTMAPYLSDDAVVVSNTSSFSLEKLSANRPFPNAIGLVHFFNPADIIPLVEVVRPVGVDPAAFDNILDMLKACGKVPVVLKKDVPGFIANRLQAAVLREACHLVASGVADEDDVDAAMREGVGLRWACAGPFRISDYGGLDVWKKVLESLLGELDDSVDVPPIVLTHVGKGELGWKSGYGFFAYGSKNDSGLSEYREDILRLLASRKR